MRQYGMSKLANILFAHELARKLESSGVQSVAWSPKGLTATRFAYGAHPLAPFVMKLMHPFSGKTEKEVVSLVDLCCREIAPDENGHFFHAGKQSAVKPCNDEDAARLWALSAELTGL